jgi:hypothetical protein
MMLKSSFLVWIMALIASSFTMAQTTKSAPKEKWAKVLLQKAAKINAQVIVSDKLLTQLRIKGFSHNKSDAEFLQWLQSISPGDVRRYWNYTDMTRDIRKEIVQLWLSTLDPDEIPNVDYLKLSDSSRAKEIIKHYENFATEHGEKKLSSLLLENLPKTVRAANSPYAWVCLQGIYRWFAVNNGVMATDADGFEPVTEKTVKQIQQSLHIWYDRNHNSFKWDERKHKFTYRDGGLIHLPPIELQFK